jgi:hypothetical protein
MNGEAPFRGPGQKAVQAREQEAARKALEASRASRTGRNTKKTAPLAGRTAKAAGTPRDAGPGKPAAKRKKRTNNGLQADAAALQREFAPERLPWPAATGAERRDSDGPDYRIWFKNLIGVFLLPVAWIWTLTVFGALQRETITNRFWSTEDFRCFGSGMICWMLWFTLSIVIREIPMPMRVYVLGHEATHAIWTWFSFGKVSEFKVGRDGGHIVTNTPNVWVTLSPYFYPIYCVALFLAFGVASIFYDFRSAVPGNWIVTPMQAVWFLFGTAWAFHLSFTVWMIRQGQSDLTSHGNFFSGVFIYIMNLVVFAVFLCLAAPGVGMGSLLRDLLHHTEYVLEALRGFVLWISQIGMHPRTV